MNKSEIVKILSVIAVEFPKDINTTDKVGFDMKVGLWHSALYGYDKNVVEHAVRRCLQTMHFCPKLADICEQIKKIESALKPSDDELWNVFVTASDEVCRLSGRFFYTFDKQGEKAVLEANAIYEALPEEVKAFVGTVGGLIDYGKMDGADLLQFIKPNFMRRITQIREREEVIKDTSEIFVELSADLLKMLT